MRIVTYKVDDDTWYAIDASTLDIFDLRGGNVWRQTAICVLARNSNGGWSFCSTDLPAVEIYVLSPTQAENIEKLAVTYSELVNIAEMNSL